MKRLLMLLTCLALILCASIAFGYEALPQDVAEYFSSDSYSIESLCEIENYFFVAAKNEQGTNVLFAFRKAKDGWNFSFKTSKAVPQGEGALLLSNAQGTQRLVDDKTYQLPTLSIGQLETKFGGEYCERGAAYELREGQWYLEDMWSLTDNEYWITFHNSELTYYDDYEAYRPSGVITATVQRDLRYVSLDAIPKTIEKARETLTVAPSLPASAELTAQNIKFTGGKKYSVYSAPSETSFRGAYGKAVVSTNSWIQVFGREGDWILIQYSIDAENYRFGYIKASSLPANARVDALDFTAKTAYTTESIIVTDDPLYSGRKMVTLPANTWVTWLATLGNWAYIESSTGDYLRGFVPVSVLTTDRVYNMQFQSHDDGKVIFKGTLTISVDNTLTVSVSPFYLSVKELRICDTYTGNVLLTMWADEDNVFSGETVLPGTTTSLTLQPYDAEGQMKTNGTVRVEW
ncbi:MAG: hypothetical protein ACI4ME_11330 [Aristaeellaceae bacterium]